MLAIFRFGTPLESSRVSIAVGSVRYPTLAFNSGVARMRLVSAQRAAEEPRRWPPNRLLRAWPDPAP
jgi:hypothetical protein